MEEIQSQHRKCGEETRKRLLETSLNLIWNNSYGSVSVDDICKEANVKKGSFYHFFKSKSDLTIAAFDEQWRWIKSNYDKSFSSSLPPLERFRQLCRGAIEGQNSKLKSCGHVCGCPYVSIGSELCGTDDNVRAKSAEIIEKSLVYYESAIIEAIARGEIAHCDSKSKATQLYNFMAGAMIHARIRNDLSALDGLEEGMMQLLGKKAGTELH
jgi:TetR/AcrR family transcriptional repressor of nem operon